MKYVLIIFFFAVSVVANAQNKVKPKIDSVAEVTDSTLILSARDLAPVYEELKKLPYKQAKPFIDYLERLVAIRVEDYKKKKQQR